MRQRLGNPNVQACTGLFGGNIDLKDTITHFS
jgi:hypothetical protein